MFKIDTQPENEKKAKLKADRFKKTNYRPMAKND
jgi:hypothetical protein